MTTLQQYVMNGQAIEKRIAKFLGLQDYVVRAGTIRFEVGPDKKSAIHWDSVIMLTKDETAELLKELARDNSG